MIELIAIFIGGGLGSITRYGISKLSSNYIPIAFPVATLLSNVIACIILAIVLYLGHKIQLNQTIKLLVAVGFCGGLSTFSTFSSETFELFRNGLYSYAIANILISVLGCLAIFYWFYKSISI